MNAVQTAQLPCFQPCSSLFGPWKLGKLGNFMNFILFYYPQISLSFLMDEPDKISIYNFFQIFEGI